MIIRIELAYLPGIVYLCHQNSIKLMIYYVTEKEFVPTYVSHLKIGINETEKGLYQIVYGVLQAKMTYDSIYDLIVRISKEQKSEVVKRYKLEAWRDEVKTIIENLKKLTVKDKKVMVSIPFLHYYKDIPFTLDRFEFVRFTIEEIIARGDSQMELSSNLQYEYPMRNLEELIEEYRKRFEEALPDEMLADMPYYNEIINDEMIRRGMTKIDRPVLKPHPVTQELITVKMQEIIHPSQYYKQPERFFELENMFEKHKELNVQLEAESEDDLSGNDSENNVNAKEMAGIVYFMLKATFKEAFETGDKKKLVEFFNFVLDNLSPKGKERKPDTARHYIGQFKRIPNAYQSQRFYDTVKEALKQYNFAIPEAIKEATEVSTKHRKLD